MSEPKFTPGPWVAIPQFIRLTSGAHQPIFKDGLWGVLPEADVERLPIATVDCGDDHHAPTRAGAEFDAHLIAAAPELFEACQMMLVCMSLANWEGDFAAEKARAAIAKALGESHESP
ncbi:MULTISPECIES: hypothetical protein [unclassified Burkholderia]|uniref:hypothetical protein n=1 Tax=unclassified Burkholderia TaxID=2613784 RepID=UPI000F585400|nr:MULTISPECIES: hypothetical protein [unclassified Burkholderia]RQR97029.1 hypothetical protein DIE09_06425 [Burkholderia sp. Bp9010]